MPHGLLHDPGRREDLGQDLGREDLRPIDGPTWRWIYAMGEDGVEVTLER